MLGLAGLARSGKDTAAQHLVNHHGFQAYAFADPLRDGLMHILNLSPCDFEGPEKEQPLPWLGRSPRQLMQSLGTEWGRNSVHPELWLLLAAQNLDLLARTHDTAKGFVVSDIRFENEADFIRKRGGLVIHLRRPGATQVNSHVSERGIEVQANDIVITNNGSIDDFQKHLTATLSLLTLGAAPSVA
ncbi:deoxynucleotide monophosphate kinase family protein [Pseudomonas pharyngis]|uniref:deoxynucleotide monophosphate kinase family protein n=1 Tax=Pseudomonas pharyngis TaxID=2892333 RepID=UPI003FD60FB6